MPRACVGRNFERWFFVSTKDRYISLPLRSHIAPWSKSFMALVDRIDVIDRDGFWRQNSHWHKAPIFSACCGWPGFWRENALLHRIIPAYYLCDLTVESIFVNLVSRTQKVDEASLAGAIYRLFYTCFNHYLNKGPRDALLIVKDGLTTFLLQHKTEYAWIEAIISKLCNMPVKATAFRKEMWRF